MNGFYYFGFKRISEEVFRGLPPFFFFFSFLKAGR